MPKVTVDHTGSCDGYHFEKGVPVNLPEHVIEALGNAVEGRTSKSEKQTDSNQLEETKVSYKDLQTQAKELGLSTNGSYDELKNSVDKKLADVEEENRRADKNGGQIKDVNAPLNTMVNGSNNVTK